MQTFVIVVKKIEHKHTSDKKYHEIRELCHYTCGYRGAAHSICNLKVYLKNFLVFHNWSKLWLSFLWKELVERFKGQFTGLAENIEKYIISTVLKEK